MKKSFKPLLLIALVAVMTIMIMIPVKNYAKTVHLPGKLGSGPYGLTCWCPWINYNCGCAIAEPEE